MLGFALSLLNILAGCAQRLENKKTYKTKHAVIFDDKYKSSNITTFMHNSGWCWFQDPRAIIHNDTLIIGGVAGNDIGDAAVGVFDLKCNQLIGRKTLHAQFDHDDHNSPVY